MIKENRNMQSLQKFKGIFPALVTPFTAGDELNLKSLRDIIEMNLAAGVNGFYVCGSTGEAFLLTDEERKAVYETAAEAVNGRATLIAHVGCVSTAQTVSFAKYAEKLGYDAVSAVAPFYYKFNFEEIKAHYFAVADAVSLPVVIYNVPVYTGVSLSVSQASAFLKDERFIGIKHTSGDYFALERFKQAFPDKMCLAGLSMGADGAIGSTYNFMADKFLKIRSLFQAGKSDEALKIQHEANRIISIVCELGVIPSVKEILTQMGYPCGDCRRPFALLDPSQKERLKKEITNKL